MLRLGNGWTHRGKSPSILSVLTLGEVRKGATLLPPGDKRQRLEMWLETDLPRRFASRLLPIDGLVAEIWGAMAGQTQLAAIALAISPGWLRQRPYTTI